jgi:hypothetical protein
MGSGHLFVGHLTGKPAMQVGHELLARCVAAQPRRPQLDGGLHLLGFEVIRASTFGGLPSQQALHEAA